MKKVLLFSLCSCLLLACNKNVQKENKIDASKQKLLMDKAWQLKDYTVNADINDSLAVPVDKFNTIPDCIKDNYYIFNSDTVLTEYDHYSKCAQSDPDTNKMYYSLTKKEGYLTVWTIADSPEVSTVTTMTGKITYPNTDSFILEYQIYDDNTKLTSGYTKTFVKLIPD